MSQSTTTATAELFQRGMDKIQHDYVEVRGLKLHLAEIGSGPVVFFLHGFPEIWYSWRHQMIAVAEAGFRAIAPDYRGYGLSEIPAEPEKTTFKDLINDLLAILDLYGFQKVFLVGKDFGARVAHHFTVIHKERVSAVITLGVPFLPPGPGLLPNDLPQGFYMLRWREPGRAERDFGRLPVKTVVKNIYILFSGSELPVAKDEEEEIMDLVDPSTPLPSWFTEDDLDNYAKLYENSGFQTALQVPYRGWLEDYGVNNPKVNVPSMLIMGEKDYAFKFGGLGEYIKSGIVKEYVPDLEVIFIPEGTHFVQEQFPDKVNNFIITYLHKHV